MFNKLKLTESATVLFGLLAILLLFIAPMGLSVACCILKSSVLPMSILGCYYILLVFLCSRKSVKS